MTAIAQFTVAVPRQWVLTSNLRLHWRAKAQRTGWIRTLAKAEAASRVRFRFPAALCTVYVIYPDRRRRDVHNLMPTIKACIDGFVDAGLLPDDSDKHLTGPDLRVADVTGNPHLVELTFRFELRAVQP